MPLLPLVHMVHHVSGVVTATAFHGDGANVTGISTLNITNYGVGLGGGGAGIGTDGSVNTVGIITAGAFFTTGIITAANFVGSGEGLTQVLHLLIIFKLQLMPHFLPMLISVESQH